MRTLLYASVYFVFCAISNGQQYQLKNGRRFALSEVKIADKKFVASIVTPTGLQEYNFTSADISSVTFPYSEPFAEAQKLFVQEKYKDALDQLEQVFQSQKAYIMLPGSLWSQALMLQLDIMAKTGKNADDAKQMKDVNLMDPSDIEAVNELADILKTREISKLQETVKTSENVQVQSRSLLRCGDLLKAEGKIEEAAKTYMLVTAFFSTEPMLSLRATVAAAECVYQMQRREDAVKLLSDYMIDNPNTPYKDIFETKIKMFKTTEKPKVEK
jgi:tetratricopeptide (TPR) repeat protein